jgi:signal transduction histidine kinase
VTLRWRISIALVVVVALGAIVFGIAARTSVEFLLYQDVDRQLEDEIRRLAGDDDGGRRGPRGRGGRPGFDGRGPGEFFGRGALIAQVQDSEGDVLLRTSAVESIGGLPQARIDADDDELLLRTIRVDGERYRLAEANGPDATIVQVARPLDEVAGFLGTLGWVLAAAGVVAIGAALLLGPWLARTTLRPVEQMTRTARGIAGAPRELATRVEPAFADPELLEFADAINGMLEAIEVQDLQQRRFVADASHELRTPLTSLGGNATYLDRSATLDPDAREALDAVGRDVDRLVRIADGLTVLARLDAAPVVQREPVDVDALVRESIARIAKLYPAHVFEREGTAGTHLLDAELVRRIVDNLVDNAGRYTPAGTRVDVRLDAAADRLVVDVVDDGPGLGVDERAEVLERFRRGSTSAGISGTGLGLAIVDEAARALGGSLVLSPVEPTGLACRVELRSAPRAAG